MTIYEKMLAELEARKGRSAWDRGVSAYARELILQLEDRVKYEERNPKSANECREWLLNGADSWYEYSNGGSALIYNSDIADRLCTPSHLKRTKGGERAPNSKEDWLGMQSRALFQAAGVVTRLYENIIKEENVS